MELTGQANQPPEGTTESSHIRTKGDGTYLRFTSDLHTYIIQIIVLKHPLNLLSNTVLPTATASLSWSCPSLVVNTEECRGLVLGFKHTVGLPFACLLPTDFSSPFTVPPGNH